MTRARPTNDHRTHQGAPRHIAAPMAYIRAAGEKLGEKAAAILPGVDSMLPAFQTMSSILLHVVFPVAFFVALWMATSAVLDSVIPAPADLPVIQTRNFDFGVPALAKLSKWQLCELNPWHDSHGCAKLFTHPEQLDRILYTDDRRHLFYGDDHWEAADYYTNNSAQLRRTYNHKQLLGAAIAEFESLYPSRSSIHKLLDEARPCQSVPLANRTVADLAAWDDLFRDWSEAYDTTFGFVSTKHPRDDAPRGRILDFATWDDYMAWHRMFTGLVEATDSTFDFYQYGYLRNDVRRVRERLSSEVSEEMFERGLNHGKIKVNTLDDSIRALGTLNLALSAISNSNAPFIARHMIAYTRKSIEVYTGMLTTAPQPDFMHLLELHQQSGCSTPAAPPHVVRFGMRTAFFDEAWDRNMRKLSRYGHRVFQPVLSFVATLLLAELILVARARYVAECSRFRGELLAGGTADAEGDERNEEESL